MDGKATTRRARSLRRNASSTERFLWKLLRDRRLEGLKSRRRVPIGPYVVDFLCRRHRLVVEADGPFHNPEHDAARDAWLAAQGFRVLRFTNNEIGAADHRVMNRILTAVGRPSVRSEQPLIRPAARATFSRKGIRARFPATAGRACPTPRGDPP